MYVQPTLSNIQLTITRLVKKYKYIARAKAKKYVRMTDVTEFQARVSIYIKG